MGRQLWAGRVFRWWTQLPGDGHPAWVPAGGATDQRGVGCRGVGAVLPGGVLGVDAALNVTRLWVMDDFHGAQAASDKAKRLGKIALGIGVTIFVLYFAFIIAIVAVGVSTAPTRTR